MSKEDGLALKKKLQDHDKILQTNANDLESLSLNVKVISGNPSAFHKDKINTSNRIDGHAAAHAKATKDLPKEIEDLKT